MRATQQFSLGAAGLIALTALSLALPVLAVEQTDHAAPKAAAKAVASSPDGLKLSVEQIIAKHVAARGGVQGWKTVHALQFVGKVEAGTGSMDPLASKIGRSKAAFPVKEGAINPTVPADAKPDKQVQLPIVMDFERPNKSRVEVEFGGKTAVQVFDGAAGWKLRPFLNRNDVEPFTADELKSESSRAEPEGVLVDYAAKGSKVVLEGSEKIEDNDAWRIKVTQKDGRVVHVWVDAKTFLDVRVDGTPRRMDGKLHDVHVAQRDFRTVDGVVVPFVLETSVDGYPDTHKLMFEKVLVNPKFDAGTFAKPKA